MDSQKATGWRFIDENGTFQLDAPHRSSYLYFPLVNEAGMKSAITPNLNGDAKTGQNQFLLLPVSAEDLHNTRSGRNFWVTIEGTGAWSAAGCSAPQIARQFGQEDEEVTLKAGFLWHEITRRSPSLGLEAKITSFVPQTDDTVELMKVNLTNCGKQALRLIPTAAIPLFGRSADNLRDHRHVTSLLHRIETSRHGVSVHPTLSFDERGHLPNQAVYFVVGFDEDGEAPVGFFPTVEEFIGEGGSLDWPEACVKPLEAPYGAGHKCAGYEAMGALRYRELTLQPGESRTYLLVLGITNEKAAHETLAERYGSVNQFEAWLKKTQSWWEARLQNLAFKTGDACFDQWMKWVALQPALRRLYGNSFLPYHDYGRGGRGWRDLWQDCLALLLMEPEGVRQFLYQNFAGVRIDGSNATIIGSKPGEFLADRNNIARVWMDHGAWPYLTSRLYLDQTGDLDFLLEEQVYFKDGLASRAKKRDLRWESAQGQVLRTASGEEYQGTILEHILVQHLTAFYNAGDHSNLRLENADWNDAMDMAPDKGESVAFSALYAANLRDLAELVEGLERRGITQIALAREILPLLDTTFEKVNYSLPAARRQRLDEYCAAVTHTVSGEKLLLPTRTLAADLRAKGEWLAAHIRQKEWTQSLEGYAWFNGYYDNQGRQVEGDHPNGVRMTLSGQVFSLMGGLATPEQVQEVIRAARRYLYDVNVGGYRLNSDFGDVCLDLGRAFGFAFGHKENGAMFSHMAVMYANALYCCDMAEEGWRTLTGIYQHCCNFPVSRIYPGIPEYVSERGRGMYTYLTGSASWYLLTMLTRVFGVRGELGDLRLDPQLLPEQFDQAGNASVRTIFAGRELQVCYTNPQKLGNGRGRVVQILINGLESSFEETGRGARLKRPSVDQLSEGQLHIIQVKIEE